MICEEFYSIEPLFIIKSTPKGVANGFNTLAPLFNTILLPGYGCRKFRFTVNPSITKVAPLSNKTFVPLAKVGCVCNVTVARCIMPK